MSEILIFRHVACEGPGYLAHFLRDRHIDWRTVRIDEGDALPESIDGVRGLVFLGGPMSVNDDLPWIAGSLALIRAAHERSVPVLGHCLGAQLIARALGGEVLRNPVPEIGWLPVGLVEHPRRPAWCRSLPARFDAFHWHHETFSLPDGAIPLFYSDHCKNQGFSIDRTLAIQFHLEMLPEMVNQWTEVYAEALRQTSDSVQGRSDMTRKLGERIVSLQNVADQIYNAWIMGSS